MQICMEGSWLLLAYLYNQTSKQTLCGLYFKCVNIYGAYCSLFCGLLSLFGLGPIKEYLNISLSGASIGLATLSISVIMMFLGSFLGNLLFINGEKT